MPTIATGDVHAHTKMGAQLQDAFVALALGETLDATESRRRPNHTHILATPAGMAARFAEFPGAAAESVRLAETLKFDLTSDLGYRYPGSEDENASRRLAEICGAEFERRYPAGYPRRVQAARRLEEELQLIGKLGFSGFFDLHYEVLAAGAGGRDRGPRAGHRALAVGAWARPGLVGLISRLLFGGALAYRPDRR